MSVYVLIEKAYEDDVKVIYNFGPNKNSFEQLEIVKESGLSSKLESNVKNPYIYYLKAVTKLIKHNKANPSNQYPAKLIYAS